MTALKMFDRSEAFDVTVQEAARSRCVCLFTAGRGGNPHGHLPLPATMASKGCTVVTPIRDGRIHHTDRGGTEHAASTD